MTARPAHHGAIPVDAILDNATAALFLMDASRRCTYMNPAAEALTGFTLDDVRGRVLHEVLHHTRPDGSPYPIEQCPIGCSLLRGERARGEEVFVHRDGRFYDVAYAASLVHEDGVAIGVVLEVHDITERVRVNKALRLSEARFRTIADAMPQMVWSTRADGTADYFNRQCAAFTGLPLEAIDHDAWHGITHPDDRARLEARWHHSVATGEDFEIEYRLRHREGDHRWTLSRALPVRDDAGAIVRWMGTCTDIHDQKLTQTALELSEDALRAADRRKDEFLAMLAHELRNPLAPIRTAAALIERTPEAPPAVRAAGTTISRQAGHLSRLVDDLLDVSRVTRDLIELDLQRFDLRDAARAALEQARPLIEQRRHALEVRFSDAAVPVRADRTRLVQVIANLLNNAARYSPEGASITLRVHADDARACVEVVDTGAGIDPALLPHVFDLFTQGRRTLDRRQGGLGIGLALVRRIVALHGGEVGAHSEGPGTGSRFTITLPRDAGTSDAAPGPAADAAAPRPLVLTLVDDNDDALQTMALLLEAYGHRVHAHCSAESLLDGDDGVRSDAYLLDIGLPGLSGYELARELRRRPGGEHAAMIALTGYGQPADVAEAKAARFDAHLVKPVDPDRLLALLARLTAP